MVLLSLAAVPAAIFLAVVVALLIPPATGTPPTHTAQEKW